MQAYRAFETDEMKEGMVEDGKVLTITHKMIEKMKKVVSSHCAALDHNKSYLDKIIKEEGLDIIRTVVKFESNSVPCNRVPSAESSTATRSTRSKRRK